MYSWYYILWNCINKTDRNYDFSISCFLLLLRINFNPEPHFSKYITIVRKLLSFACYLNNKMFSFVIHVGIKVSTLQKKKNKKKTPNKQCMTRVGHWLESHVGHLLHVTCIFGVRTDKSLYLYCLSPPSCHWVQAYVVGKPAI